MAKSQGLSEGPSLLAGVLAEVEGCVLTALEGVDEISFNMQVGVAWRGGWLKQV